MAMDLAAVLVTAMVTAMAAVVQEMVMVRAAASVIIAKVMDMDLAAVLVTVMVMVIALGKEMGAGVHISTATAVGRNHEKSIED